MTVDWLFLCPPTKSFGGNGTNVVFETGCSNWTTNSYLFCEHMCLCVFEVGLAFSFKPSASRQTISSHPDKRRRLISSQPLWKASVHLQPVQERCGANNAQQGRRGRLHNHPTVYLRADQPPLWKIGFRTQQNHKRFLPFGSLHRVHGTPTALQSWEVMRLLDAFFINKKLNKSRQKSFSHNIKMRISG